jgi:hypothetical protein
MDKRDKSTSKSVEKWRVPNGNVTSKQEAAGTANKPALHRYRHQFYSSAKKILGTKR